MDGYPSTPLNLSDGTTVTQAGGERTKRTTRSRSRRSETSKHAGTRSPARNTNAPKRCSRTHPT
ncbi:MAG: hypothetical protein ACLS6O_00375 [Bifidobacterium sp.]